MKSAHFTNVTVARGRSITVPVVTGQQIIDGVPQVIYGSHVCMPDETVEVEVEEAKHLIATGFAVDPDAPPSAVLRQDGSDPRDVRMQGWDQSVA